MTTEMPIGDLVSDIYAHFLALYGDAELAAVATAAVVNDILTNDPKEAS